MSASFRWLVPGAPFYLVLTSLMWASYTLCINSGPWMIQPAIPPSPRSRSMKAMTEPAAVTT